MKLRANLFAYACEVGMTTSTMRAMTTMTTMKTVILIIHGESIEK